MRDDLELDLFLADLRAWVKKTTGEEPDGGYKWFYNTMYRNYPSFLLWQGSRRVYSEETPKRKNKGVQRRFHLLR